LLVRRFGREMCDSGYRRHRMASALTMLRSDDSSADRERGTLVNLRQLELHDAHFETMRIGGQASYGLIDFATRPWGQILLDLASNSQKAQFGWTDFPQPAIAPALELSLYNSAIDGAVDRCA